MAPALVCHSGFWSQSTQRTSWPSLVRATSHLIRSTFRHIPPERQEAPLRGLLTALEAEVHGSPGDA
eukprot:915902-Alexandrium_andersonii.AAC.1